MFYLDRYKLVQLVLREAGRDRHLKRLETFLKETGFQIVGRKFRARWHQDPVFLQALSSPSNSRTLGNWFRGLSYRKKPESGWLEDLKQFPLEEKYRLHAIGAILSAPLDVHDSLSEDQAEVVMACLRGLFDSRTVEGIVYEDDAPRHSNMQAVVRSAVSTLRDVGSGAVMPIGTGTSSAIVSVPEDEPEGMQVTLVSALEARKRRYAVKLNGHLSGRCPDLKPDYVGFVGRLYEKFDGWMIVVANVDSVSQTTFLTPVAVCRKGRLLKMPFSGDESCVYPDVGMILARNAAELADTMLYMVKLETDDFEPCEFPVTDAAAKRFGIDLSFLRVVTPLLGKIALRYSVDCAQLLSRGRIMPVGASANHLMLTVFPANVKNQIRMPMDKLGAFVAKSVIDGSRLVVYTSPISEPDPSAQALVGQEVWLNVLHSLVGPFTLMSEKDGRLSVDLSEAFGSGNALIKLIPEGSSQYCLTSTRRIDGKNCAVTRVLTADETNISDVSLTGEYREFLERASFFLNPTSFSNGRYFQDGGSRAIASLPKPPPAQVQSGTKQKAEPDAEPSSAGAVKAKADAGETLHDDRAENTAARAERLPAAAPEEKSRQKPAPVAPAPEPSVPREKSSEAASGRSEQISGAGQDIGDFFKAERKRLLGEIESASSRFAETQKQGLEKIREECRKVQQTVDDSAKTAQKLNSTVSRLDGDVNGLIERFRNAIADSMTAGRMLDSLGAQSRSNEQKSYAERSRMLKNACESGSLSNLEGGALTDYLCSYIHAQRPSYSRNFIVSLAVLMAQNFITIFSGDPGCGKTSACTLLGHALGLTPDANEIDVDRFLMVSVEKGWTNRRDMFGYYNPLSGAFVSPDPRRQAFLRELHADHETGMDRLPYLLLLDEANLSQIEYYCTDFISMADKRNGNSQIALGDGTVCHVPDTLRILMTANADQTVESFSPRLLDRAWVVSMPEYRWDDKPGSHDPVDQQVIDWQKFVSTYGARVLDFEAQKVFESHIRDIAEFAQSIGIGFSPRTYGSIRAFFSGAIGHLQSQYGAYVPALDFAVAQKILPRVSGHGEAFRERLESFRKRCALNHFDESRRQLDRILARGDENVGFYQFF